LYSSPNSNRAIKSRKVGGKAVRLREISTADILGEQATSDHLGQLGANGEREHIPYLKRDMKYEMGVIVNTYWKLENYKRKEIPDQ
jgi:hypothetical protein